MGTIQQNNNVIDCVNLRAEGNDLHTQDAKY